MTQTNIFKEKESTHTLKCNVDIAENIFLAVRILEPK